MIAQRLLFLLPILLVALVGCRRGEVQSVERNPDGTLDVTVRYTEADFNEMIEDALLATGDPLLRDPDVNLQNGQVTITGSHITRDGSGQQVFGSMVATVTVSNGALLFQVISVDIEGVDPNDSRVQTFNANAQNRMMRRAEREGRVTEMLDIEITDSYVDLTFNVDRQND